MGLTVSEVELSVVCLTHRHNYLPLRGARKADGKRVPVLVQAQVQHVKRLFEMQEGVDSYLIRLVQSEARQLLHTEAPLAAYVWNLLGTDLVPKLRLDVILRTSSGS